MSIYQLKNHHAIRAILLLIPLAYLGACQTSVPSISQSEEAIVINDPGSSSPIRQNPNPNLSPTPIAEIEKEYMVESFDNLWDRLYTKFQLTEHYNHSAVDQQLSNYVNNQAYFDHIVERAEPFLFWIVSEIEKRELPMELALIPIVESTFNPNAYSPEHAVGLWQFIAPTARSFGLQQDWWYDARRDPRESTIAALNFLEELYSAFNGNWLLALAAYNTGEGNVNRAIKLAGLDIDNANFWSLNLASETRTHVPKILALAKLISNSTYYGIELSPIANEEPLVLVNLNSQIDLKQAASLANLEYKELRKLNPGYLQWATHPDSPQSLIVPIKNAELLQTGVAKLDPNHFVIWDRYEIMPGDTLGAISQKLGTRVDILLAVNQLNGTQIIAGDSLLVPRTEDLSRLVNLDRTAQSNRLILPVPEIYIVRRGDNLWSIARKFDLRSAEIASKNGIAINSILQPGQIIKLMPSNDNSNK